MVVAYWALPRGERVQALRVKSMVKCRKCGEEIKSGEKVVVQYDGLMMYEKNEATPTRFGSLTKYWHKKCKPWHE